MACRTYATQQKQTTNAKSGCDKQHQKEQEEGEEEEEEQQQQQHRKQQQKAHDRYIIRSHFGPRFQVAQAFHRGTVRFRPFFRKMAPKKRKVEDDAPRTAMDRTELSKMLGHLRYNCSDKCAKGPAHKDLHSQALTTYNSLDHDRKGEFLAKFMANRKDLSFAKSFQSTTGSSQEHKDNIFEGYCHRNEILKLNGFDGNVMDPAEADTMCKALVTLSEQEFAFETKTIPHALPLLTKWLYKKHQGIDHTNSSFTKDVFGREASGDGTKFDKAFQDALSSSSSTSDPIIKVENPPLVALRARLVVLKSAKSALEKRLSEGRDLAATLQQRAAKDAALTSKHSELTHAMDQLDVHIGRMRELVPLVDACDGTTSVTELAERVESTIKCADTHLDGSKAMFRRFKVLFG